MADSKLASQAQTVLDLHRTLNAEIGKLEALELKIKNEWCGYAADTFGKQLTMLITDMKTTKENLYGVYNILYEEANK